MKTNPIFILLLFICFTGAAQNYTPFPTDSAVWRVNYYSGALGCPPLVAEYQYTMNGDTQIASVNYKKIFRSGVSYQQFCYPPAFGYAGAIREDSGKHIYLRLPNANADTLLYDFNLSVGDTVINYLNYTCTVPTVSSIDSVLVGSSWRKRFNLYDSSCGASGVSFIEGIGSTRGLLEWTASFESAGQLECFQLHGQTLYPDTISNCPLIVAGIPERQEACSVFCSATNPNAVTFSEGEFCQYKQLFIYNSLGQKIYSVSGNLLFPLNISSTEIGSGIFYAQFSSANGETTTVKFLLN